MIKDKNPKDYIKQMTPMSDILLQMMFEDNFELVKYVIRIITGIDNL